MVNAIIDVHKMDTEPLIATGHEAITRQYLSPEERAQLQPGQLAPELRDDQGRIIHEIEVMGDFERFGQMSTECYRVRVPECNEIKQIQLGTKIRFDHLIVTIRTRREGGSSVTFEAEGMHLAGNAAPMPAPKPGA